MLKNIFKNFIQYEEAASPDAVRQARRITTARMLSDLVIGVGTFILLNSDDIVIAPVVRTGILSAISFILLTSVTGWLAVINGYIFNGLGLTIYGLTFGLFGVSMFVADFGFFTLVVLSILTSLTVATTVSQKRAIQAILVNLTVGISALLIDIQLGSEASFRTSLPAGFSSNLWIVVSVLAVFYFVSVGRQFYLFTLRTKLVASFVFVTLISLALLGYFNGRNILNALTDSARGSLFAAGTQTKDSLEDFLTSNLNAIQNEANLPILLKYLELTPEERSDSELFSEAVSTLWVLRGKNEYVSSYALLDLNGNNLADTDAEDIGSNKFTRKYFIDTVVANSPKISDVIFSPRTGEASIYFSAPVIDSSANAIGILRVRYDADILQDLVERSNDLIGEDSFGVLFDENFIHLAHGADANINFDTIMPLSDAEYNELLSNLRLPPNVPPEELFHELPVLNSNLLTTQDSDEEYFFEATDPATADRTLQVVAINLDSRPWILAFFQPEDIFLAPVKAQTNVTTMLSIVIAGGVVGIALLLSNILLGPINRLTEVAEQISQGNLAVEIEATTNDEIGLLTNTFNTMSKQLGELVSNLESQVEERTNTLMERATQLQIAAEVARDATREQNIEELLDRAVNLISERFDFYHVGIYIIDPRKEYALMMAGSDVPGKMLKDTGHRYRVSSETNIGNVSLIGEALIATDNDEIHGVTNHPLLPNTHAQLVIPLRIGNEILGALDIHSEDPNEFEENDIAVFRTLADQLAISLQKNELREESERALNELETAYGLYTKESWQNFIERTQKSLGYKYRQLNFEPVEEHPEQVLEAWNKSETIYHKQAASPETPEGSNVVAIPMAIRGETIGVLNIEFEGAQIPTETNQLILDLADRLSLILENARLVEAAQHRVNQERLINQVSNKMRETLDMDSVIRAAVEEIGKSLGLAEVEIRMGTTGISSSNSNGSQNPEDNQ